MDEKYKNKIRKLLALAQSDNPYEAERARVQAEKLMKLHNIQAGDVEIITISGKSVPRKSLKYSELHLLHMIGRISGCESFLLAEGEWKPQSGRYQYQTAPQLMGLQHDAELAAYSWDVLYDQLIQVQREIKKQYGLNATQIEKFSQGWAFEACEKLVNVFGERTPPENVQDLYKRQTTDMDAHKTRRTPSSGNRNADAALINAGMEQGQHARLHNATSDQSVKLKRLAFAG